MTIKEIAEKLNGIEYPSRGIKPDFKMPDNVVIAYGMSDDLLELEGAIEDEYGAYGGAEVVIDTQNTEYDHECQHCVANLIQPLKITAKWDNTGDGPCWRVVVEVPFETFNIMEGGEIFSVGVVFEMPGKKQGLS